MAKPKIKIPVKGKNPALEVLKDSAQKTSKIVSAMRNSSDDIIPTKDFINKTLTGMPSMRNGGKMSSQTAKAKVFTSPESIKQQNEIMEQVAKRQRQNAITESSETLISNLTSPGAKDMREIRAQNIKKKHDNLRSNAYDKADDLRKIYGTDNMDEVMDQLRKERNKQIEVTNNSKGTIGKGDIGTRESIVTEENSIFATMSDKKFDKLQSKADKKIEANKLKSPSGGKPSANQNKMSTANLTYKVAAMGVGGGLVLSLASNRGQQSNQQLYGQGY